ncbi:pathogen-related protein [Rutstroemia sp. NJR-2017a BVV2]|nr:pathogen-related protein [Rutstroemia sp. NJR-2017a BVV2]
MHIMASADVEAPPADPTAGLPDYLLDPNAVMKDLDAKWRYKQPPDYTNTRKVYAQTKTQNHTAASLPSLVENLVKNWEVEASFKTDISDWRTIDHPNFSFSINGNKPVTGEYMLKVGTYNAILPKSEYYDNEKSDFSSSHKTFKRMMPTFAWEVLEVYSGPPVVSFKWRHWGVMKNDYVGVNDKNEKVHIPAHNGTIDIQGVAIAHVDAAVRMQAVEIFYDPAEMFRQIAKNGNATKTPLPKEEEGKDMTMQLHGEGYAAEVSAADLQAAAASGCPFVAGENGE